MNDLDIHAIEIDDESEPKTWRYRYYIAREKWHEWLYDHFKGVYHAYWKIVPYNWRPGQIWYRLKCFCWHRYTTVRPRTIPGHGWCDRSHLLPHMMFEILSQFIEKECSPGIVDWEGSDHRVNVNGVSVNVRTEMQAIYDWWHKEYLPSVEHTHDEWHEFERLHRTNDMFDEDDKTPEGNYIFNPKYDSAENKEKSEELFLAACKKEADLDKKLKGMMHRIVRIVPFMWT